ncbi:heparan-alpha-glucosaminide N-acetyltransferase domain-containing protein [Phycisphaera mikurensis]|uniref:Hypothetical membrane protein n=1 Tax=Phycisphaera mikurensis (strain NBRC 102666 / KCTC 22515 / FYK2301M01) TaxID=1142394 RepID=I0IAZ3_PHYMF|nr:heparan-alpha-glucosaminide N-acetyltransferase domain-containing protein [Phycisphaera mikurensis]MBB6442597.1 hypothetical protein [Phycisphaera mikurensis]BAM02431.1 hypothetical membrane protein [Phycisphaera mikurensis NBRC 102666]
MMWPELDLLRGLAGLAMVVNHTAVGLVPAAATGLIALPDAPLTMTPVQWASFLGSFAPMIFFFITGVGYGLQARAGGVGRKPGLWSKAAVLVFADAMLWRVGGLWIGLDFFGFIALSMVLLGSLNRLDRRHAIVAVAALLAAVSVARYAAVPLAGRVLGPEAVGLVAQLTGHRAVSGISFPPMPWLGYPLAGFLVGAAATASAGFIDRRRVAVAAALLAAGAACLAAAAWFAAHGYPLHRWGRLAPSSYAAGFAVLAALLALCLLVFPPRLGGAAGADGAAGSADRGPRPGFGLAVRGLSLRGVAAFAVVPLHFLAIDLAELAGVATATAAGVFLACGIVAAFALGAAPLVMAAAERVRAHPRADAAWFVALAAAAAALAAIGLPALRGPAGSAVASLGQLALCLLLALPLPRLAQAREPSDSVPARDAAPAAR